MECMIKTIRNKAYLKLIKVNYIQSQKQLDFVLQESFILPMQSLLKGLQVKALDTQHHAPPFDHVLLQGHDDQHLPKDPHPPLQVSCLLSLQSSMSDQANTLPVFASTTIRSPGGKAFLEKRSASASASSAEQVLVLTDDLRALARTVPQSKRITLNIF